MAGVIEILLTDPDIKEKKDSVSITKYNKFEIEFRNVYFSYDNKLILNNISFKILSGQTCAIIGTSGIGKSTIAKLLMRLYDVDSGQILINDIDIRNISMKSLYEIIGFVPQETFLFNESIISNIDFIKEKVSLEDIIEVSKKAELHNFVNKLPAKYETIVGANGLKLSRGERQRISIARLFLKKSKICIFDEPTASLDEVTESSIFRAIDKLKTTNIIITHNLSSLLKVDQIIDLKMKEIIQLDNDEKLKDIGNVIM